ncbi:MAG: hypothetical protein K2Y39_23695 [Candidatus Obscuribacterales bacterium]|nr:hypothetical protein [Candidatus Obscuribacterales bacterium]
MTSRNNTTDNCLLFALLIVLLLASAQSSWAASPKTAGNLPSNRVGDDGVDRGSNLKDQQLRYDKQFIRNRWSADTHDSVDWPTRVLSDPDTDGKNLETQRSGEKLKGVRYKHELQAGQVNQTHTAQSSDGNLPWQGMATTGPLHDPRPLVRLQDPSYADFRRWQAPSESDRGMSPESVMPAAVAEMHSKMQGASEATANGTTNGTQEALSILKLSLLNIANEATGTPGPTNVAFKPLTQCIWMVQTVFKQLYLPFALLLLLPGAVLSQVKSTAVANLPGEKPEDESPFNSLLKCAIAVFLIPATQLIVSYSIDVGNSLSYEIQNVITGSSIVEQAEAIEKNSYEAKYYGDQAMHLMQNTLDMSLTFGLVVLIAFQTAMMCYLLLMGPMAAAFLAWPGGLGRLFKPVFSNWLDAVITLSLWRFWWCAIVLVMQLRIGWLKELGLYDPYSQWEALMFSAFLVLMTSVPFAPFDCKPGEMVEKLMQKAQQLSSGKGRPGSVSPAA